MATMFGRFEIQSELSKSETASIFKALDTETNQVVALKTQSLEPLGEGSDSFVERLVAEGEGMRELAGQNIVALFGAGEIEGQFCASMEYIQGNSIATMLARKEGFSIWDLLDITRQVCAGLELASAKGVVHHSLEPAKIMVQWDGMVKILGYGISNMSLIEAEAGKGLGRLMPYCSPEQIRGEAIDLRSNVFTLGAILYEMVVSRQAFDAADPVTLVSRIENDMPAAPVSVNAKIHPAVSALIMKALAKDPAERYQSSRELVEDLEKCKESGKKAATEARKSGPAPKVAVDPAARAAAASKFVSAGASAAAAEAPSRPASPRTTAARLTQPSAAVRTPTTTPAPLSEDGGQSSWQTRSSVESKSESKAENKAAAAAAGAASAGGGTHVSGGVSDWKPAATSGADLISDFEVSVPESHALPEPVLSAALVEPEVEEETPRIAGDPMMSEPAASAPAASFSDMAEMPPLKGPVFAPSVPETTEAPVPVLQINPKREEKPRIQPREVAEKAISEIATVPPRLMLFSILGAVAVILVIAVFVLMHVRSEDDGSTAAPRPVKAANPAAAQAANESAPQAPATAQAEAPVPPLVEPQPDLKVRQIEKRNAKNSRHAPAPAPAPVVVAGQALVDSMPQGAQFQIDGKSDPSWITPFTVASLGPGKHIVSVSKSGYTSDTRSVDIAAGGKSSLVVHLAPMNALMVVNSTPAGAEVIIDGKPTSRVTPAQFAVEKGSHTVLLRKQGFLDETVTADLGPAQNFQYSPTLRALGNADEIKTVGKFNKLFGRGGDSTAGMGSISIHSQPKGAQVAINQHMLDKLSPIDVMLGPGNYIVDITLTGFKPVHKVVSVDKGGKVAIEEIMERQ
jgi:serine/threonine protein kinase